ncbi:outer membrane protein assembly factor BamD [Flocculibacter collagenilyticus]|uniref:outer membrane protein assembly factor BamD n=1 Tax=Flocculibacter collagenilyticus TaxID=2744479 RepID=UPI0018F49963|nr:outer membrane protein assembly factor BamD [Flocculibacter collagenilyticus]
MIKFRKLSILIMAGALAACSSSSDEQIQKIPDRSAQALYQDAKETLEAGLHTKAIQLLTALNSRYPFGPFSKQAQLDLIYAYYKVGDVAQATATIDRFVRLNPNHPDLDYVTYMRGVVNMEASENAFQEFFGIDRADRDASTVRESFKDFQKVTQLYPDSKYAADAKKRMAFLLNKLARRELMIAEYYTNRGAHLAAANRGKYVLENYPNSPHVEQALEIMIESYGILGLNDLKEDAIEALKLNFPDNDEY